jgi:hypothetical protein
VAEIHRCSQEGVNNQERDLNDHLRREIHILSAPQSLRSVVHLYREMQNNSSRNQLVLSPLELGWRLAADHQRTQVQNLDIPK